MFELFQAGWGRYSNDFEMYKESYVPEFQPGGGGWSIFQLSLNNLYQENQKLLNWWTKSNKDYNLVRYISAKLTFYRQPKTDYVVTYQTSYPFEVGKFHFPSSHPQRLLTFHQKIIVPSFQTLPHWKKASITKKIKPPKEFINRWYFQSKFCQFPLIMITSSACSLSEYFIGDRAESSNVSLFSINTDVFTNKNFRDVNIEHHQFGYVPNNQYYLWGTRNGVLETQTPKAKDMIYLGDTTRYTPGIEINEKIFGGTTYNNTSWGNPFYKDYINKNSKVYISNVQPTLVVGEPTRGQKEATNITLITKDLMTHCRYNPYADKGDGNVAKWLNVNQLERGWDTEAGPELTIQGFPLWILLWGWEDWTRKLGRLKNMDTEYILVIHSRYIKPPLKAYVFMSDSWTTGQGPYDQEAEYISQYNKLNWQPCWQYQKEAIENLLMSGPGVARNKGQIHAHMKYNFLFKWGGHPNYTEQVTDPCSKRDYPLPGNLTQGPEIADPTNDPTKEIYPFDIRRNLITQTATKRLLKDSETEHSMFTDGESTSTDSEAPKKKKKKTSQKKEKTIQALQLQLQQLKQHRYQLRHRFYRLTKQLQSTKYTAAMSE